VQKVYFYSLYILFSKTNLGQLGTENFNNIGEGADEMGNYLSPIPLGPGVQVSQLSMGLEHVCMLFEGNQLKCWGF